jgi:hypothetical protein
MSSAPSNAVATADEVELTADELQGMATVQATLAEHASAAAAAETTVVLARKANLPSSILYIALSLGVAAAAVSAFIVVSSHAAPDSHYQKVALRTLSTTVPQQPDPVIDAVETETAPPPVRFTNPFDKSEVFEFPAGTTRAEARDAVADILLQRAQGRKDLVRTHNHRK